MHLEPGGYPIAAIDQLRTLNDAGDLAFWFGLKQLWYHQGALPALGLPEKLPELEGGAACPHPYVEGSSWQMVADPPGLRPWTTIWRDGPDKHRVELCVPSWDADSPYRAVPTPDELLAAQTRFERATGILWRVNGAWTSDRLLTSLHQGRGRNPIRPSEIPSVAIEGNPPAGNEPQFSWWRRDALTAGENKASWCHGYDKHGMFLSAASGLKLGVGRVEHRTGAPEKPWPGYYRIRRPEPSSSLWPDPFHPMTALAFREEPEMWVTAPSFAAAGDVEVLESYTYPEQGAFLDGWYKHLKAGREATAGDPVVQAAIKAVYQKGIGYLGHPRPGKPTYQPNWRHSVNAVARLNVWRNLTKLAAPPFLVHVDEAWWFTRIADPARFAARLGLELGDGLKHWAPKGSIPGGVAREMLRSARTPQAAQRAFGDYVKQSREG
jgi:hypothetical protein